MKFLKDETNIFVAILSTLFVVEFVKILSFVDNLSGAWCVDAADQI